MEILAKRCSTSSISDVSVRRMNLLQIQIAHSEEDIKRCFSIRKKVFVEEQGVPLSIEIDDHDQSATHLLVSQNGQAIGAGRFRWYDDKKTIKVERICMLPTHRGQGNGRELMQKVEEFAIQQKATQLLLNAQVTVLPFYEKLGYEQCSEEFMDAGIAHVSMQKNI